MTGKQRKYFSADDLKTVDHAVAVCEDIISDWYRLTISSWKKYKYNIRTLRELSPDEIVPEVFAQIVRYGRPAPPDGMREGDVYSICLQDQNILNALEREPDLKLFPLLIYVLTHELIHIVRFYTFSQFFDASQRQKNEEERRVHKVTYDILNSVNLPDIGQILEFYSNHRELVD